MEGTYRSSYKKNVQRDGCLLSNFAIHKSNIRICRRNVGRLLSPLSTVFPVQRNQRTRSLRAEPERGTSWKSSRGGREVARASARSRSVRSNQTGVNCFGEQALKKRFFLCNCDFIDFVLAFILSFCDEPQEDRNAQTNFRNGPHGRWKYSLLPSATIHRHTQHYTRTFFLFVWQTHTEKPSERKHARDAHAHAHTRTQVHARIHFLIRQHNVYQQLQDYSSTERMCIQHQRSSYVTITTAIYTDLLPVQPVASSSPGLWRRFDETVVHLRRARYNTK